MGKRPTTAVIIQKDGTQSAPMSLDALKKLRTGPGGRLVIDGETLNVDRALPEDQTKIPRMESGRQVAIDHLDPLIRREISDAEQAGVDALNASQKSARAIANLHESANAELAAYKIQGKPVPLTPERVTTFEGMARQAVAGYWDGEYPKDWSIAGVVLTFADAAEIAATAADAIAELDAVNGELAYQQKILEQ